MKSGKYSAICEKLTIQKIIHDDFSSTGRCNFYLMDQHLMSISFGMIFQKGSPLLGPVNEKLHMLVDLGLRDTWISDMVANLTSCDSLTEILDSHGTGAKAFSLQEMASFFFIVVCGLFLATLGFITEKLAPISRQ